MGSGTFQFATFNSSSLQMRYGIGQVKPVRILRLKRASQHYYADKMKNNDSHERCEQTFNLRRNATSKATNTSMTSSVLHAH